MRDNEVFLLFSKGELLMKSIQNKLILFTSGLVILTVLIISVSVALIIRNTTLNQYEVSNLQQLQTIDKSINLFYEELDKNIDMFAENPLLQKSDESITDYIDFQGGTMTPSQNGGVEQEIYEAFQNYGQSHPSTLYVYMGTKYGGYIQWPETQNSSNYDPRVRPWYELAIEGNGQVLRTNPYEDSVTGTLIVSNARTFVDSNGELLGVMAIDASSGQLSDIMKDIKIGENGYAMIIHGAGDGLILADPKHEENNNKVIIPGEDESKNMVVEIPNLEMALDESIDQFDTTISGSNYLAQVKHSERTDWVIITFTDKSEMLASLNHTLVIIALIALLVIILSIVISTFVSRRISKPIHHVSGALQLVAKKDFTVQLDGKYSKSKDETGTLVRTTGELVTGMSSIVRDVQLTSNEVSGASKSLMDISEQNAMAIGETSKAIEMLAERTTDQAMDSRNLSETLVEIEGLIDDMTSSIGNMKKISKTTIDKSKEASSQMSELENVKIISIEKTSSIGELINQISTDANNAEAFTTSIESISNQTNLLALNASIEAARAGEAGKGFAVVAEEIRKLAEETNQATIDINNLIQNIKDQSMSAVDDMELVKDSLDALAQAINKSEEGFNATGDSLEGVVNYVESVYDSSMELAEKKEKMFTAVNKIIETVNENSAVSQEVSAAIEEENASMSELLNYANKLNNIATILEDKMNEFKTIE